MLKATELTLQRAGKTVIDQVNVQMKPSNMIGVLGNNGAGKSTLFYGLSGELNSLKGHIMLGEKPLKDWPSRERARHLAILPQITQLNFSFLVSEVVHFGRLPHNTKDKENQQIIKEILALTDIEHLAHRNYLQLSGGERQRVHLARVLAQLWPITHESVLLLDEPTSMLDPLHQHTLLSIIKQCVAQGASVMVILHDLNLASRYCNQLMVLQQGRIFTQGTPLQVLTTQTIKDVFGLDTLVQPHPELHYPTIITR